MMLNQQQQQNINVVKKLYENTYSGGDISLCDQFIANNVRFNDPASPHHKEGIKALKETETIYAKAFPNKKAKIEDIFANDDKVVVRWSCTGTHKGTLQSISPTNKNFNISGISIYQFANGKIVSIWQSWDRLGLLEQIGEVQPAPALHY